MKSRKRLSKSKNKKIFRKGAKQHRANRIKVSRGGITL